LSAFEPGTKPAVVFCAFFALSLGGCSSWNSNHYSAEDAAVAQPQAVAQGPASEVEADGMPVQTPPVRRANQMPDDPSEPYSRNYGGPNPSVRPLAKPETPKPAPQPVRQAAADNNLTRPYWKVVSVARQDE
jgi:hypothetical protein